MLIQNLIQNEYNESNILPMIQFLIQMYFDDPDDKTLFFLKLK